jgi:hypothetical protein
MDADRRRGVVEATFEALRHTGGRDEHMPDLHAIVDVYRGDLDEKRATIRMRSRCRGVGQDARVD